MNSDRRVAITGLGIVSCLGNDIDTVMESLRLMRCGIEFMPERKAMGMQSGLSGVIRDIDVSSLLSRKQRKTMPEFCLWAWKAVSDALVHAGIERELLCRNSRAGMIMGNDSSAVTAVEQVDMLRKGGSSHVIGSGHIFRLLNSTITLNISVILGMRGCCWTISSACASGAMAIGQGAELIRSGKQDIMICGGVQEISWQAMCSFDALGAFSSREDAPHAASRPFDAERDGLVPGGGAAVVILEDMDAAKARGANVLGEVAGYGACSDGFNIVVPDGKGLERAARSALDEAGLTFGDIDLVLAHATSTPAGDRVEAEVLANMQEECNIALEKRPAITAVKALTGHEFWMAGASAVVYGLLMAEGDFVTGNRNLETPDPAAEKLLLPKETVERSIETILCNASGFGGTNACLVIKH